MEKECSHAVQLHGLCALCGKDVSELDSITMVNIIHGSSELKVTAQEAERIELNSMNNLLKHRKLSLVVDLDQTILHASVDPIIDEWLKNENHPNHEAVKDVHRFYLNDSPIQYFLKLRKNLKSFLEEMSQLYELHIYTMGTRSYAHEVVKIIDPNSKLFHDRILSRDDSGSLTQKDLSRIFPCGDSMVLVIDDRADVWKWAKNLIKVKPYDFFMSGDINDPEKLAKKEEEGGQEEKLESGVEKHTEAILVDNDNELEIVGSVLRKVHKLFYLAYDAFGPDYKNLDVKIILSELKEQIFEGVQLVFSGIIPIQQEPSTSNIWRMATEFGATCSNMLTEETTHLVASNPTTVKVRDAVYFGIPIVTANWIFDSVSSWERKDVKHYLLPNIPSKSENLSENPTKNDISLTTEELEAMNKEVDELLEDDEDESTHKKAKFESELYASNRSEGGATDDLDSQVTEENRSDAGSSTNFSFDDEELAKQLEEDFLE